MSEAAAEARQALAHGDLVAAYDITASALADEDVKEAESEDLRHLQLIALARMGDTARARGLFDAWGLGASDDPHRRALGARLLKDEALAKPPGPERAAALSAAYAAYRAVYDVSGDPFPGINAASLALLAGEDEEARRIAQALLAAPGVADGTDYYLAATRAEALLLLGRADEAAAALRMPAIAQSSDHGGRSTTARQLAAIADHVRLGAAAREALLVPLRPPRVVHYAGHMFRADPAAEARLSEAIGAALDAERAGFAFGSLASGADLLFAEAALERGLELVAVLPFAEPDFLAQSVRPGGAGWEARYRACRDAAKRLVFASEMEFFGDPGQYGYAARVAMGQALLRARHLGGEAVQLAIWDGKPAAVAAGTGADVTCWRAAGGRTVTIAPGAIDRTLTRPPAAVPGGHERALAAILFTDFQGFSTLSETALPAFWEGVMGRIAAVLDRHGEAVQCRNSWGDALYAVTSSAVVAAEIALELQDALADLDYAMLGLTSGGMRIGVHYGPAYRTGDPITGRTTFYGTEVSKAARIEPVTPPGAVFVTEPLAAVLALEAADRFGCAYVGRIPLAKKYGDYRMYRLTRV